MRFAYLPLFALLAVLVVSGCTGGSQAPPAGGGGGGGGSGEPVTPGAKTFSVTIGHTSYSPASFEANRGDTVRFLAKVAAGTESHNHGITIDEYGINEAVTSSTEAKAIEFVADKAGTFSMYCKTCWDGPFGRGHPDIRATLVVK
ncbi:MAG: cupredoxin domain-containing protein [Candidatus Aenigmarchaeota archaeon]|nr:cupredoxin domain-containing protein [Candidatus Aenigmarchaeota archaeon]